MSQMVTFPHLFPNTNVSWESKGGHSSMMTFQVTSSQLITKSNNDWNKGKQKIIVTIINVFTQVIGIKKYACELGLLKGITQWWTLVELCHEIITVTIHVVRPCSNDHFS